jgi:hypothetical protein
MTQFLRRLFGRTGRAPQPASPVPVPGPPSGDEPPPVAAAIDAPTAIDAPATIDAPTAIDGPTAVGEARPPATAETPLCGRW